MMITPTNHLRFLERTVIDPANSTHEYSATKKVRILQQFFAHPSGGEVVGDMFSTTRGEWRDVPVVQGMS